MEAISLLLYNISIRLYEFAIYFSSFFNNKAKLWIEGRKQNPDFSKLGNTGKRIWFHCASLGEFEQARPVIEKIKKQIPDSKIVLSFFSPSGYEIRKNYELADLVLYLPLDTEKDAQQFIKQIKPDVTLFVKYEFWYNYLNELKSKNIPVILFSSVFRKDQVFFKWYGGFFRSMLTMFDKIFVQNTASRELLSSISVSSEVAFDTRFDRVYQIAQSPKSFPLVEKFKGVVKLFIAGSTWEADDELILRLIANKEMRKAKFIIAPHDINDEKVNALINCLKNSVRLSELTETNAATADVIIVDSIGNLASLYAYADIAYVGGGFNTSVHNILEPAVYGMPVLFGPNNTKSVEASELIEAGAGYEISGYVDLLATIGKFSPSAVKQASQQAKTYVETRLGGAEVVFDYLQKLLY